MIAFDILLGDGSRLDIFIDNDNARQLHEQSVRQGSRRPIIFEVDIGSPTCTCFHVRASIFRDIDITQIEVHRWLLDAAAGLSADPQWLFH